MRTFGDFGAYAVRSQEDYTAGKKFLTYFHNYASSYYPSAYTLSLSQLYTLLGDAQIEAVGLLGLISELSDSDIKTAMESIVKQTKGQVPSGLSTIFKNVLINKATSFSWSQITNTLTDSIDDIVSGTQKIGQTVISSGQDVLDSVGFFSRNLKWLLPVGGLAVAGIYFWVNKSAVKSLTSFAGIKKAVTDKINEFEKPQSKEDLAIAQNPKKKKN